MTECDDSQLHVLLSDADALEHELQGHSPPPWPSQVPRTIRPSEAQSLQAYRGRSQIPQDSVVQLLADLPRVPQPAPSTRQAPGATHTQLVSATKTFPTVVVPCVATPFTTTTSFINTTAQATQPPLPCGI